VTTHLASRYVRRSNVHTDLTVVDWIIIAFVLAMAIWGYSQGLIVGLLSLAGFAAGAFLGSRLGPLLLNEGSKSPYAPLTALMGALVVGGILASVFEVVGGYVRRLLARVVGPPLRIVDGVGGAALLAFVGLGVAWIAGAVALQTPGLENLRRDIQRSAVLAELNKTFPPSGPVLNALARFDPLPTLRGPNAQVPPPSPRVAHDPEVRFATRSTVKVLGTACGLGIEGSGWVGRDGVVVTNAHVVAGESDTTVQVRGEGPSYDTTLIWFDPRNDLALLSVPALRGRTAPLELDTGAKTGTAAAIIGFPENGPLDVEPARLGPTTEVLSDDAYGDGPLQRLVTTVRGRVRPGNSGGPVVDGNGRVVGTIFASTTSSNGRSGLAVPDSVVARALQRAGPPVSNGPCAR
jgi:S1-C subfamily serine protease